MSANNNKTWFAQEDRGMKERLGGALLFALGVCLALVFRNVYRTGGELFSEKLLMLTPLLLLVGLTTMIEPRIVRSFKSEGTNLPVLFKAVYVVLFLIAIAIGVYMRFVVFKEWHR
jgi:hypothetical protein